MTPTELAAIVRYAFDRVVLEPEEIDRAEAALGVLKEQAESHGAAGWARAMARSAELEKRAEAAEAERDEARKWWEHWQHRGMAAEAERDRLAARVDFLELGDMTATAETWEGEAKRLAARVTELEAHPEATCDKCGGANHTWSAPNDLWNATVGTPDNPRGEGVILCPTCFTQLVGARVTELEAALRPLANPYKHGDPVEDVRPRDEIDCCVTITFGDVAVARATLDKETA